MDGARLRAWWAHQQGLLDPITGASPAEVLSTRGWARAIGGANVYFTLWSRSDASREEADKAAASLEIAELPTARGCTYVLPSADFAIGLTVGAPFGDGEMTVARKLGVTDDEIARLCEAVISALKHAELGSAGIKDVVGGAARSLGEEGRKKGLASTLPVALGRLQSQGKIRKKTVNGRFDNIRYVYSQWRESPAEKAAMTSEDAVAQLAERFFAWIGPATVANFAWFTGLGVKAARSAIEGLDLVPLEAGSDYFITRGDLERLENFEVPKEPCYRLISALDGLFLLRRDVVSFLDILDRDRPVPSQKGLVSSGGLQDLSNNAIVDRGRIIGVWEYDVDRSEIVAYTFRPADAALKNEIARTEEFIRNQLGDARSFSLDSPKSRQAMISKLRGLASA